MDLANNIRFRSRWRTTRSCPAEAPSATSSSSPEMSLWCHDRLMRGRKYVVWILVGAIVGTVSLAQGQTQVVPVIVASEQDNSDVTKGPDIRGLLRKDDVTNTSLRVRKLGKSKAEPQCGSGGRGAVAETYFDNPKVKCVRVAGSSSP